jgi:hypothetical protein
MAYHLLCDKGEGFTMIDAVVVTGDKLTLQLVENLQRSDLTPMEKEEGITKLAGSLPSNKEAARRLSKNEAFVYRHITAGRIRSILLEAAMAEVENTKTESAAQEAAVKYLNGVREISTSVLSEMQGVKKESLIPISKRLVAEGGTLASVRQIMRDYRATQKETPLISPTETESATVIKAPPDLSVSDKSDVERILETPGESIGADDIDPLRGEGGDFEPSAAPEPKSPPAKKETGTIERRLDDPPPHKTVDLNSVQVIIKEYIQNLNKNEVGGIRIAKTDAAYEIWSFLLAGLSEA